MKESRMNYHFPQTPVNTTATTDVRRNRPKAVRACTGADILVGLKPLTPKLVAAAMGVSLGYLAVACRLPPEQRKLVREGLRPLVLPRRPVKVTTPEGRFADIVAEIGVDAVLGLLASVEKMKIAA
jgi:hypothetical protein